MGQQPMPDQEVKKVCKRWEKKEHVSMLMGRMEFGKEY